MGKGLKKLFVSCNPTLSFYLKTIPTLKLFFCPSNSKSTWNLRQKENDSNFLAILLPYFFSNVTGNKHIFLRPKLFPDTQIPSLRAADWGCSYL